MIKAFVNFLRAICINKFVLVLEVIFVTGLFLGIFRFFTTLIGFGLFNTLFGGVYHYPIDGLLFFSIIYSIASVLTRVLYLGENPPNKSFVAISLVLSVIVFVVIMVGSLFFI